VINGLYQQCPGIVALEILATKRPMVQLPVAFAVFDNARLDVLLEGQARQFISGQRAGERLQGAPDQQRLALPAGGKENVPRSWRPSDTRS